MILLLRLAARNVRRHLRRTLLSAVAVIAGVSAVIIGRGFVGGTTENLARAQIDVASGHVLLRPLDYPETGLTHPIADAQRVSTEVAEGLDALGPWTARVLFTPTVSHAGNAVRARGIGFDPARDAEVFPRDTWRVVGKVPESVADGVLVSSGLARLLEVQAGDVVVLQSRTFAGAINALQVPVAGVLSAGNPWIDASGVLLPISLSEDLLRLDGRATHLSLRVGRRAQSDGAAAQLREVVGQDWAVQTWADEAADMLALQAVRQQALDFLVAVLLLISATGIANTVLMAAFERVREIGALMALGLTRRGVVALFLAEGAIIGVIGAAGGVAFGVAVVAWYARHGIDLSDQIASSAGANIPISTVLYPAFDANWIWVSFAFGVGVSVLASWWPASRAASRTPADAMRGGL